MLHDPNVLLILGIILVAGTVSGLLARRLQLPSVTGQILIGVLMGPAVLRVFDEHSMHKLDPLVDFALGLMAVAVGSHLSFFGLKAARRRLFMLLLFEVSVTPVLVFFAVMLAADTTWHLGILLAAIAISTAPATVLALVKETRSRGAFVTTLVAAVALNNLACIVMFEIARTVARTAIVPGRQVPDLHDLMLQPVYQLGISLLVGAVPGILLALLAKRVIRSDRLTVLSLIAILLTAGVAAQWGVSVLFACLCLGIVLGNFTPDVEIGHRVFEQFESAIFTVFFTVAGMELKFESLALGGLLALVVFLARVGGKVAAGYLAMKAAGATERFRHYLGLALLPQAGLAIGLALLVTEDPVFASIQELFLAVVLSMVLLNEIVGPLLTRFALRRSGDFGQDRQRVLDFLTEQNITVHLKGPTKEDAIRQLVDLTVKQNRLNVSADELFEAVMQTEQNASTCVGEGLALPHARVDVGDRIVGAMGISHEGLKLDTPDGRPVHCMVLIITPKNMPERHLEVVSALGASIGGHRAIQRQLYHIDSPAHADELIHLDARFEAWNYYLDKDEEA